MKKKRKNSCVVVRLSRIPVVSQYGGKLVPLNATLLLVDTCVVLQERASDARQGVVV